MMVKLLCSRGSNLQEIKYIVLMLILHKGMASYEGSVIGRSTAFL